MEKWRLLTRLQLYLHTVSGSAGLERAEKVKRGEKERRARKKKNNNRFRRKHGLAGAVVAAGTATV